MSEDEKDLVTFAGMSSIDRLFTDDVEAMDDQQAASTWAMVDLIEKIAKDRKEKLRQSIMNRVKETGEKTKGGHFTKQMGPVSVTVECKKDKLPNEDVVKQCIKEAGLEFEDAFSHEMKWVMDPSKVEFLVQGGKLPEDKIEASKRESFALKVKVTDKDVALRLEEAKKRLTSGE